MHFLVGVNTKLFWNIPKEKYLAPLRTLNLFIESFVNPFINATSLISLSKSVLVTNLAISLLFTKFACFNLTPNFSDVNLLNSGVVINLLLWS